MYPIQRSVSHQVQYCNELEWSQNIGGMRFIFSGRFLCALHAWPLWHNHWTTWLSFRAPYSKHSILYYYFLKVLCFVFFLDTEGISSLHSMPFHYIPCRSISDARKERVLRTVLQSEIPYINRRFIPEHPSRIFLLSFLPPLPHPPANLTSPFDWLGSFSPPRCDRFIH